MKILVLNAGSSSQKSRLYEIGESIPDQAPEPLWEANADWTKEKDAADLKIKTAGGPSIEEEITRESRPVIIERMLKTLWSGKTRVIDRPADVAMIGHRIVHGGADYRESVLITPEVKAAIQRLSAFAPLHNPANLEGVETCERLFASTPQVAVFDTAFHSQLPRRAAFYAGPYEWFEQGIRRYGFHGISHQYCARRGAQILGRDLASLRIINCHLGNGCSLAAIQGGHSIDTTMGFTPLEGLMMGTRSGSLDPSILTYLQREKGYSADRLEQILNKESGLKGISGISSDLRQVMQAIEDDNERAELALEMFIYRLRYFIGAMLAALGGVDALIFTGGIGENAARVRAEACAAFGFLKLKLDEAKNAASPADQDIATPASAVRVLIVHTEEDWEIARECWRVAHKR
ncbi:MAG TPA: acetate kinase [Ktedonobacteraceae bacterium]|jgi:acetate kinase|nr:acetate kinase [Ktedonobacteraceae bacterium]